MRLSVLLLGVVSTALTPHAVGQTIGDAFRGKALAAQFCSECHNTLDNDERSPDPKATSFPVIANTWGMTAMALGVWMQTGHPTMPNIRLKPETTDDIIAYILSLRTRPASDVTRGDAGAGDDSDDARAH